MPNHRRPPLPVHVFVGTEPPADLIEAARRGECIVAHGDGPKDRDRWARALARFADHLIDGSGIARQPVSLGSFGSDNSRAWAPRHETPGDLTHSGGEG